MTALDHPTPPSATSARQRTTNDRLGELTERTTWRWAIRGLVIAPIVVAAVRAVVSGWFPVGDDALLAVRAYDVGTVNQPWLGSWTSASLALGVDVNNPGPLYYDIMSPAMWIVGRPASIGPATAIGVATVNALAGLGVMVVGRRLGGWAVERWMALMVALVAWAMGSALLIDIWQPHALLLPFVALLVLTTALLDGRWRLLPWWVFVVSLVVQTHVAYVYVIGTLGVLVAVAAIGRWRRDRPSLGSLARTRAVWVSAVVAAICWLQPVGEQLFGRGQGNLSRLASAVGNGDVSVGLGQGARMVAAVVAVPPGWTRFGFADAVATSTPLTDIGGDAVLMVPGLPSRAVAAVGLAIVVGLLTAQLVWTFRRRRRLERSALVTAAAVLLTAFVGIAIQTVTVAGFGSHQVRWMFALAPFVHVVLVWVGTEWVTERRPSVERVVAVGVPVLITAATVWNLMPLAHPLGPTADQAAADVLAGAFEKLDEFDPGGAVVYDTSNVRVFEPYSSAIVMALTERGVDIRFEEEGLVRQYGENRRAQGDEVATVRQYEGDAALSYGGPGCVVALSTAEYGTLAVVVEPASACAP